MILYHHLSPSLPPAPLSRQNPPRLPARPPPCPLSPFTLRRLPITAHQAATRQAAPDLCSLYSKGPCPCRVHSPRSHSLHRSRARKPSSLAFTASVPTEAEDMAQTPCFTAKIHRLNLVSFNYLATFLPSHHPVHSRHHHSCQMAISNYSITHPHLPFPLSIRSVCHSPVTVISSLSLLVPHTPVSLTSTQSSRPCTRGF